MNTVVTYYEPVLAEQEGLLAVWRRSWEEQGWVTFVATEEEARAHPLYQALSEVLPSYPTVNDPRYERACWLRWLAYASLSRGGLAMVATDYDVFNRGFRPGPAPEPGKLLALHRVPTAACLGGRRTFDAWALHCLNDAERGIVRVNGKLHVSDMTLARVSPEHWATELHTEEWWPEATAELVHVSHEATLRQGTTKQVVAAKWRREARG